MSSGLGLGPDFRPGFGARFWNQVLDQFSDEDLDQVLEVLELDFRPGVWDQV